MNKRNLITLLLLLFVNTLIAQKFNILSKHEKDDLKILAKEYIEEFNQHLKVLPKMSNESVKNKMIGRLLRKFQEGAIIQVANSKTDVISYPVSKYLAKVLKSYGERFKIISIEITSVDIYNIKPMEEKPGYYYADFVFVQKYARSTNNLRKEEGKETYDYADITTKKGKFIIKKVTTSQGTRWKLFFGDIYVVDYKKIKG